MNPIPLLLVLALSDQKRNTWSSSSPPFEPIKLDVLLDQLQGAVATLDKVNRLSQIANESRALPLKEAAPALPAPADALKQLAPQLGNLGDIQALAKNLGPILNMLGNSQEK